jgi:hypothetical protein
MLTEGCYSSCLQDIIEIQDLTFPGYDYEDHSFQGWHATISG